MANVIALPMRSTPEPQDNLAYLRAQLQQLQITAPTLVCLPETWLAFCATAAQSWQVAQHSEQHIAQLAQLCREFNIWLAAGTIATPSNDEKYYATSLLFNDVGEVVARYNKIHLFDADVNDSTQQYRESARTQPGDATTVVNSPFGLIGLSVCYDLRFPGLYQRLRQQGAELILVPSAFTCSTGAAHWQPLLQARAIETQCYVIAAAQSGHHDNGRDTYGHSLIVSPWGEVLGDSGTALTPLQQQLDLSYLKEIRGKMPVASHNRFKSEFL
ncbi:carbon-nitrogen hydrolase family protein [Pseudoalteromonas 'SMAR']|uniref:carbon-nitrogen hydrolase family protein n=1 Tax=Pseudoalteromonas 'SMAR' TaxID=3416908 RepID=UPI003AF2987D